jgi:hypothetical protein
MIDSHRDRDEIDDLLETLLMNRFTVTADESNEASNGTYFFPETCLSIE